MTAQTAAPLTRLMAQFATAVHAFPPPARSRARDAVIDCVGCMLAGSREPLAAPLREVTPAFDAPSAPFPALLLGGSRYAAPADAALFNGAIAHALDYDDTNHPAYAHPSAVIVPALLAVAPLTRASGSDFIDAYIVGFELFGKLGRAMNTQHYKRGWHATGTFGALAAVVAAGRLLGLDADRMTMAIGIAASAACGLRASFGSMTKPLHAGYAARNGVLAALLARSGFTASAQALEHPYGYLGVFNAGIGHDPAPLETLGHALEILTEYGLALKPYPACGATHPGIEAAEELHRAIEGAPIRSVRAGVCEMAFAPLIHVMPDSPLEGKFSLHFCIAAALVLGKVNLATFSERNVADPRIRALIPKISMELDPRWRDDGEFATEVRVTTEDGANHVKFVPLARGKPARWFSTEQLRAKFGDCAAGILAEDRLSDAWEALADLDSPRPCALALESLVIRTGEPVC